MTRKDWARCRVSLWSHRASHWAHKGENSIHLTYFAALSTGLVDYHMVAAVCLVVGLLGMLPEGTAHG